MFCLDRLGRNGAVFADLTEEVGVNPDVHLRGPKCDPAVHAILRSHFAIRGEDRARIQPVAIVEDILDLTAQVDDFNCENLTDTCSRKMIDCHDSPSLTW